MFIGKERYWCLNKPYIVTAWYLSGFEWGALQGLTGILKVCGLTGGFKALVEVLKNMRGRQCNKYCCWRSPLLGHLLSMSVTGMLQFGGKKTADEAGRAC